MNTIERFEILLGICFCLLAVLMINRFISTEEAPVKEIECQETEWVQVTHRDGFWYCFDNDTSSWNGEWKPATRFEKRRVGL